MSPSRRLVVALLTGSLVLWAGGALGQTGADHWAVSRDGRSYATNDTAGPKPTWSTLDRSRFPAAIAELEGPSFLYRLDGTQSAGARVARLVDVTSNPRFRQGQTPVFATAVVDGDERPTWARRQHIVSMPEPCPSGGHRTDCLDPVMIAALVDLNAPDRTLADAFPPVFPVPLVATSTSIGDGTIFSLGGDASVRTTLRIRDDGRIAARGTADISDAVGGSLGGFETIIVEDRTDEAFGALLGSTLQERARQISRARPNANGVFRQVLDCPASGRGTAISQFLVRGVGGGVGPAVDPALEGGAPVIITEARLIECAPTGIALVEPPEGPAAAVVCALAQPRHRPFTVTVDGKTVTHNSSFLMRYIVAAVGLTNGAGEASTSARVGGANGGRIFAGTLKPVAPGGSWSHLAVWVGQTEVGIDTFGAKPYRDLQFTADGQTFDLVDQWRQLLGEAFDVGPNQKPVTNCPGVEFTPAGAQAFFSDGFEDGDITAWAPVSPD